MKGLLVHWSAYHHELTCLPECVKASHISVFLDSSRINKVEGIVQIPRVSLNAELQA
jgi:hypothetical protein